MLSDVLWGRGHKEASPLLPPCTEVLGPGDGTCLQGLRGRGVVVKGTGAGLPGCPEDTGWGEGLGCHPQGMGLEQSRPPATQGL